MKKRVTLLLALMSASAMLAAGCGGGSGSTGAEETGGDTSKEETASFEEKQEGDTFTVGFDQNFPPMGFVGDDGEYTGFDLDLAKEVCERQGWEFVPQPIAWETKDATLNSGEIDCIWNGFTMNGREDDYTWSDPYVDNSQVMVVAENSGIETFDDLAGKVVGVQAASAALQLLQDEEGQKALADTFGALQEFADYNSAFVELQAGSVQAVAMDIGVAQYQIKTRGEGFKIMDEKLNSEKYAIGFKLGNEELRDKVNADLQTLLADGTFDELAEKYELSDMVCLEAK